MWLFVDHPCKFHALPSSVQEIPHAITSTHNHFHVFQPIAWVFFSGIPDSEGYLGYDVWWMRTGSKALNKLQTFGGSQYFSPYLR